MPFDDVLSANHLRGSVNHLAGLAGETAAERHYLSIGFRLAERRWRGGAGEIDLILFNDDLHVFVEVKTAATFDKAAERLTEAQLTRVSRAAEEYMGSADHLGTGHFRIDAALVDGRGRVSLIENVTLA